MNLVALMDRHPVVGESVTGKELRYTWGGKGANQAVVARRTGEL
jgi:ribokinase